MPSWSAFNSLVSEETVLQVTKFSTVYTSLKNFQDILKQLDQRHLAVTCDEGVYQIAKEIQLMRPYEFKNIVLCMGSFHMAKCLLTCIGKYLRGSGAKTANSSVNITFVCSI